MLFCEPIKVHWDVPDMLIDIVCKEVHLRFTPSQGVWQPRIPCKNLGYKNTAGSRPQIPTQTTTLQAAMLQAIWSWSLQKKCLCQIIHKLVTRQREHACARPCDRSAADNNGSAPTWSLPGNTLATDLGTECPCNTPAGQRNASVLGGGIIQD